MNLNATFQDFPSFLDERYLYEKANRVENITASLTTILLKQTTEDFILFALFHQGSAFAVQLLLMTTDKKQLLGRNASTCGLWRVRPN